MKHTPGSLCEHSYDVYFLLYQQQVSSAFWEAMFWSLFDDCFIIGSMSPAIARDVT